MEDGDPTKDGGKTPPLGLPDGSVRAVIALIVVITTCTLLYMGIPQPDWWILTFTGVIAAYYGMRNNASNK